VSNSLDVASVIPDHVEVERTLQGRMVGLWPRPTRRCARPRSFWLLKPCLAAVPKAFRRQSWGRPHEGL